MPRSQAPAAVRGASTQRTPPRVGPQRGPGRRWRRPGARPATPGAPPAGRRPGRRAAWRGAAARGRGGREGGAAIAGGRPLGAGSPPVLEAELQARWHSGRPGRRGLRQALFGLADPLAHPAKPFWKADLPGFVHCPGTDPLGGGGIGGDTAAILLGLKLYHSFPFMHRYITLIAGSHHLISQAGWNRCNLSIYLGLLALRRIFQPIKASETSVTLTGDQMGRIVMGWSSSSSGANYYKPLS